MNVKHRVIRLEREAGIVPEVDPGAFARLLREHGVTTDPDTWFREHLERLGWPADPYEGWLDDDGNEICGPSLPTPDLTDTDAMLQRLLAELEAIKAGLG
jgi:hypothetical protein